MRKLSKKRKATKEALYPIVKELLNELLYEKVKQSVAWYDKPEGAQIAKNLFFEKILNEKTT